MIFPLSVDLEVLVLVAILVWFWRSSKAPSQPMRQHVSWGQGPQSAVRVSLGSESRRRELNDCLGQFHTLATSGFRGHAASPELAYPLVRATEMLRQGSQCQGRRLSMGLWGLAKALEHPAPPAFFDPLLELLAKSSHKFTVQGHCTVLWALATLRPEVSPRFIEVFEQYLAAAEAATEELDETLLGLAVRAAVLTYQDVPAAQRLARALVPRARQVTLSQSNLVHLRSNFQRMGVSF